jgi:hypothetical protein
MRLRKRLSAKKNQVIVTPQLSHNIVFWASGVGKKELFLLCCILRAAGSGADRRKQQVLYQMSYQVL